MSNRTFDDDDLRSAQDHVNRRGRRLLREVAALLHGPDVFAGLPGDDGPLPEGELVEIKAQAAAIVQANTR